MTSDENQRSSEQRALTDAVVASFGAAPDARLRTVLTALVEHLHALVRETELTEKEWSTAIDFLTRVGHITDERRQEFILLSDVLGVSMQTVLVNDDPGGVATQSTVFGPFFTEGSPRIEPGGDIARGATGEPCWVEGTVTDAAGRSITGARIEVWEADDDGRYDVQYGDDRTAARAHLFTDEHGRYRFWALTPTPYPIPADGPVGELLAATRRSPLRAPHLHLMVSHPGSRTVVTHIFVVGDDLGGDSVFGIRESLVVAFEPQPAGTPAPDDRDLQGQSWSRAEFDIVLVAADDDGHVD